MGSINSLIRSNIKSLKPYSSARDEYEGGEAVFLDANENPYFPPLNRYPDPRQRELKNIISQMQSVPGGNIFLGNGSDEAIDILIRAFCDPGTDNIVSIDPTYGMYEVAAAINGVEYRKVLLGENFVLDTGAIEARADSHTKIIFLCSPNNPTGNSFDDDDITGLFEWFGGVVVVDEAYIEFSGKTGLLGKTGGIPRLVVLRTLSKGWGRAGIRIGMAFAGREIIDVMNKIKPPYNINSLSLQEAISTLQNAAEVNGRIQEVVKDREALRVKIPGFPFVEKVYPSDANFLLVKTADADALYRYLRGMNIIVRNRTTATGCENCLRITVGSGYEIEQLLQAMQEYGRKTEQLIK
jgi:histidinol-phosphate aminotransferase